VTCRQFCRNAKGDGCTEKFTPDKVVSMMTRMKLGMAQFQAMIEAPESICYCMVGQTFYKNVTGTKDPQIWKQANVTALEIGFGNQPCYSGGSYHPSARL